MSDFGRSVRANLLRANFYAFVKYAFRQTHGNKLGEQQYIMLMCYCLSQVISGKNKKLLINLPPQHLKSFVGTICLAAFLLGLNPRLRILVLAYNDRYAAALAEKIRDMMQSAWYRAIFATRLKDGRSRADDFETTEGGGVFAAAATGSVTGRTGEFIIYDDPHEIPDWNNERKLEEIRNNFNTVLSRRPDKVNNRIVVIAHRLNENDLSAYILDEFRWKSLRLPLIAPRTRKYDLGHDIWVREKGDVLRRKAYPKSEIESLKRTQLEPSFGLFHQQGLDPRASFKPRADHFQSYDKHRLLPAPVVLSVDPGQSGGINASRSAIQAWKHYDGRFYLIDQFCDHCDFEQLRVKFWWFATHYRASVVLIEKTANGPALYSHIKTRQVPFEIKMIRPTDPKGIRLARHFGKIGHKRIYLPEDAIWREPFIDEIIHFPGEYDDQVDAMTQYFDYMDTKPVIPMPRPREIAFGIAFGSQNALWRKI